MVKTSHKILKELMQYFKMVIMIKWKINMDIWLLGARHSWRVLYINVKKSKRKLLKSIKCSAYHIEESNGLSGDTAWW